MKNAIFFFAVAGIISWTVATPKLVQAEPDFDGQNWTQTSQNDFESGTSDNLDLGVSSGDIYLEKSGVTTYSGLSYFRDGILALGTGSQSASIDSMSGELRPSTSYYLNHNSDPQVGSAEFEGDDVMVNHINLVNGILYLATNAGLTKIDTKNTIDFSDDELIGTLTSDNSAMTNDTTRCSFVAGDSTLYICTGSGLVAISNSVQSVYSTESSPALINNVVNNAFISDNKIYVSTNGGLTVLDLGQWPHTSRHYTTASDPAIVGNNVYSAFIADGRIYVSTSGGVSIINNNEVTNYNTGSSPALGNNNVRSSALANGILYVATDRGLTAIEASSSESFIYNADTDPFISNTVYHVNAYANLIYVSQYGGLSVIDTAGTISTDDDRLLAVYNSASQPRIAMDIIYFSMRNADELFIGTANGMTVVNLSGNYRAGLYQSSAIDLDENSPRFMSWKDSAGSNISMKTRNGDEGALWRDEFDDGNIDNIEVDYTFNSVEEQDGRLILSDADTNETSVMILFPEADPGSRIKMKMRYVGTKKVRFVGVESHFDSNTFYNPPKMDTDWMYFDFAVNGSDYLYIYLTYDNYSDLSGQVEIDWIEVENSVGWNEWTEQDNGGTLSDIGDARWLQYRATLNSENDESYGLQSVEFADAVATSGEFISSVFDAGARMNWYSLNLDSSIPEASAIAVYTRSGNTLLVDDFWSEWELSESGVSSPSARYFQYKLIFTSDDLDSPVVHSVSLNYYAPFVPALGDLPAVSTRETSAKISVSGEDLTHYKFKLDSGEYSSEKELSELVELNELGLGDHSLSVIARDIYGKWESESNALVYNWTIVPSAGAVIISPGGGGAGAGSTGQISEGTIADGVKIETGNEAKVLGEKILAENIEYGKEAGIILNKITKKIKKLSIEMRDFAKYLSALIDDSSSEASTEQASFFISYGTENTENLGKGERAGLMHSYHHTFGKLPDTEGEWGDVLHIADGRWPSVGNVLREREAQTEFEKIYKRNFDLMNAKDISAIKLMSYGLLPGNRNLDSEKFAIRVFKSIYGMNPSTTQDWNIMRAIAYSGAKRGD